MNRFLDVMVRAVDVSDSAFLDALGEGVVFFPCDIVVGFVYEFQRTVETTTPVEAIRTSYTTLNGRTYQNLDAFAPEADWELLDCTSLTQSDGKGGSDGL